MPMPRWLPMLMAGAASALTALSTGAHAQSVALSFEDGFDPQDRAHAALWNASVLSALAEARVTAIFFPLGARVDSPEGLSMVREWGEAGHLIGNRGYAPIDRDMSRSAASLVGNFRRGQMLLDGMPGWLPRFRLTGTGAGSAHDALAQWFAANHYKAADLSIDVSDDYYSSRYQAWHSQHPRDDATRFRNAYLSHLWNRANYYDQLSTELLHRSVPHVLRLHTNAINASFLSSVIEMFRDNGWDIISPEKAYADRLYTSPNNFDFSSGSVLWSLASQKGVSGLRFPAEDASYERPLMDRVDFSR